MRPVLVGIDSGKNDAAPLSPKFSSGLRLAKYAGMTEDVFRDSFDCVNLHALPGVLSSWDWYSVQNFYSLLRGRRVVALGRRVALAFEAAETPYMNWRLDDDYVITVVPHPSGRSRLWNDLTNVVRMKDFMRNLSRPCIHVEGPDGSGKSTLVKYLGRLLNYKVIPTQGPPKAWAECHKRIQERIEPGIVCDRSSGLISELVYGPVIRGETVTKEEFIWDTVRSLVHTVTFVYCRPPTLHPTFRKSENSEHVERVKNRLPKLLDRYDEVMSRLVREGGRVIRYDYTAQAPGEVAECVAS